MLDYIVGVLFGFILGWIWCKDFYSNKIDKLKNKQLTDLICKLRNRVIIRRYSKEQTSFQKFEPDRISDLLDESIIILQRCVK